MKRHKGIPDLLKKVYGIAQASAGSNGKEEITPFIIKKVARENLRLVNPHDNGSKNRQHKRTC